MKYSYVHMEDLSVLSERRGNRTKDPCLLFVIIISEPPAVLFSCTAAANGGFHTSSNLQDERIFIQCMRKPRMPGAYLCVASVPA